MLTSKTHKNTLRAGCISISDGNVHFLLPGFPVTPPRNHNHPQLGSSTPADGGVKGLPWLGYIGPHGGLAGTTERKVRGRVLY